MSLESSVAADSDLLRDPSWYSALRLTERLNLAFEESASQDGPDVLVAQWRDQRPFDNSETFARWLKANALSEAQLGQLLGEKLPSLEQRLAEAPWWLDRFARGWETRRLGIEARPAEPETTASALLAALAPLIEEKCRDFEIQAEELLQRFPEIPVRRGQFLALARPALIQRLGRLAGKVMVLELHVARHKGLLHGDTAEQRFSHFIQLLADEKNALKILREYPVLVRLAVVTLTNWSNAYLELFERLGSDWTTLTTAFGLSPEDRIDRLMHDAGDSHCEGRSVAIVSFASGQRIVYRPRPVDAHFHLAKLFEWLHTKGTSDLKLPKVVARHGYGWAEYIAHKPCADLMELRLFYRRQGELLAILHTLRAFDFHNENLVASGPHPMLIDVEFLFHLGMHGTDALPEDTPVDIMAESVMRVGLLPSRQWLKDGEKGVDQSGIGGAAGQFSLTEIPLWSKMNTDEMHLERKRLISAALPNRPSLSRGEEVNPFDHTQDIIDGFSHAYRVILTNKLEILSDRGPLGEFRDDSVRYIVRPSLIYGMMLAESNHPDLLRDAVQRDRFFERLWISVETWPSEASDRLIQFIPFELEDLWAGDIPYFSTRVDSRDLWTSRGERLVDFFQTTGYEDVQKRILGFNEEDLRRHSWVIRASMGSLIEVKDHLPSVQPACSDSALPERTKLIQAAAEIGGRIERLAIEHEKTGVGWIGLMTVNGRAWTLASNDLGLYSGSPGITFFLAYLAAIGGDQRFRALAEKSLFRIRGFLRKWGPPKSVGAFEGTAGILYLLTHLATLWNREDLQAEAQDLIDSIARQADDDMALDVMAGAAGAIAALLAFYETFRCDSVIAVAQRLANRLIETALPQRGGGRAWKASINPERPLAGFSHGAAGIAWALGKLYAVTGSEKLRGLALDALEFEANAYSEEFGGWPDYRGLPEDYKNLTAAHYMTAWCHGAVGIGFSRLDLMSCLPSEFLEASLSAALGATRKGGFGKGHCLCHGDLGNLELLLEASRRRPNNGLTETVRDFSAGIFRDGVSKGWQCDTPTLIETPGLMTGLSGIGYNLLRLAHPDIAPSALLLSPPTCTGLVVSGVVR